MKEKNIELWRKIVELKRKLWKKPIVKESCFLAFLEVAYVIIKQSTKKKILSLNCVSGVLTALPKLMIISCILIAITLFWLFIKEQSDIKEFDINTDSLILTYFTIILISLFCLVTNKLSIELFNGVSIVFGFFWFCYYWACRRILKEIDLNEMLVFTITALKSIANSFLSWSIIFTFLYTLPTSDKNSQMIALPKIIVALFTLYYPVADMYMYTRRKINDYQKEKSIEAERKRKEEIENESNGSKNYTA